MTNAEKLQVLRDHQAWRMGADTAMAPPKEITAAIDYAIRCCEAVAKRGIPWPECNG